MYWYGTTKNEANTQQFLDDGMTLYSMDWTTETPTQEGWYWVVNGNKEIEIVEVYKLDNRLYAWTVTSERDFDLNEFIMWLGPIPPPEMPE